jgi:hypothetical protein
MTLPLSQDSLLLQANKSLINSAQSMELSSDIHVLAHETLDRASSYPCKKGQSEKLLPVCLPVGPSYIRREPMKKGLNIIIFKKDMVEMQGSYAGGSHSEDDGEAKIAKGIERFASSLLMSYIINKPPAFMHGLTPQKPWQKQTLLPIFNSFGQWAYEKSPAVTITTATDIPNHIKNNIDHLQRDQELSMEITRGVLVDGYFAPSTSAKASSSSSGAGALLPTDAAVESGFFITRRSNATTNQTDEQSLQELASACETENLDVQVVEPTGRGKCYQPGDWLPLVSVILTHLTKPELNNTFVIRDTAGAKKPVRIKHFRKFKPDTGLDTDTADENVDSDTT